ncbi:hypothetical protein D7030_09690 [Flavobacteriaceae bacterium AU392]|nr:hypothetical protein D1817_07120 [Flavobacteriaceae bacterium]RKM83559.1 hypothetical protein D7030_09690 [Flavobacteriaceae bacterium AU392]
MKPNLNHIKHSGYKVPKDYFDTLDDSIMNSVTSNKFKVESSGFSTPTDYFDTLEETIMNTVSNNKKETKVIPLFNKKSLIYISSIAAAALIFISIYISKETVTFDSIEMELVENYLYTESISSEDLLSLLSDDSLIEDDFIQNNLNDDSLENFILDDDTIDDFLID